MATAATGRQPNDVGGEYLSTVTESAQAGGLDHRVTEVVVVLRTHLTTAEPDAQPDEGMSTAAVVLRNALLHRDGATHGSGSRAEDDHQAIAQVLDFLAA